MCGAAPSVSIRQGTAARACLKYMNTLTDVNSSAWSLRVKHMPKCFSGLEILPFLCKRVSKYLQAGMLQFFFFFFKEGDSHLMVFMALLDVALTV